MKTFGNKVREARNLLGMNQAELGEIIGVSSRSIFGWESGNSRPRAKMLQKLAQALNVSSEYLINDDIDDPTYGIEREPYVEKTREMYGSKAAREINFLMERNAALFAGGEIPQEMKDEYFEAVMAAYLECKEQARLKYGHKK